MKTKWRTFWKETNDHSKWYSEDYVKELEEKLNIIKQIADMESKEVILHTGQKFYDVSWNKVKELLEDL